MAVIHKDLSVAEIAAIISEALSDAGFSAVMSGGSVVSIYADNEYQSDDLDFVTPDLVKDLAQVMSELGFEQGSGRHFRHPDINFLVEFLPAPLAVGNEPVRDWAKLETERGTIQILTPTQSVMDRLAAFYHWSDRQALDQAVMVARRQDIDMEKVKKWSKEEGHLEGFEEFFQTLERARDK